MVSVHFKQLSCCNLLRACNVFRLDHLEPELLTIIQTKINHPDFLDHPYSEVVLSIMRTECCPKADPSLQNLDNFRFMVVNSSIGLQSMKFVIWAIAR